MPNSRSAFNIVSIYLFRLSCFCLSSSFERTERQDARDPRGLPGDMQRSLFHFFTFSLSLFSFTSLFPLSLVHFSTLMRLSRNTCKFTLLGLGGMVINQLVNNLTSLSWIFLLHPIMMISLSLSVSIRLSSKSSAPRIGDLVHPLQQFSLSLSFQHHPCLCVCQVPEEESGKEGERGHRGRPHRCRGGQHLQENCPRTKSWHASAGKSKKLKIQFTEREKYVSLNHGDCGYCGCPHCSFGAQNHKIWHILKETPLTTWIRLIKLWMKSGRWVSILIRGCIMIQATFWQPTFHPRRGFGFGCTFTNCQFDTMSP